MNDMQTNPYAKTGVLTACIDAASLAAFDALAEARGGRSALLRQMIEQLAKGNGTRRSSSDPRVRRETASRSASPTRRLR
jgi:hypothetical protein